MKLLKILRKFERFNFNGVPERPESSFERDSHSHFTERQTGRSVSSRKRHIDLKNAKFLGWLKDDFENQKETFVRATEESMTDK